MLSLSDSLEIFNNRFLLSLLLWSWKNWILSVYPSDFFNESHATGLFPCPLKTLESLWFSNIFSECWKKSAARNELISIWLISIYLQIKGKFHTNMEWTLVITFRFGRRNTSIACMLCSGLSLIGVAFIPYPATIDCKTSWNSTWFFQIISFGIIKIRQSLITSLKFYGNLKVILQFKFTAFKENLWNNRCIALMLRYPFVTDVHLKITNKLQFLSAGLLKYCELLV